MTSKIHVAVGVVRNKEQQYLISKRLMELHQGGLWEFPGGKVELGETVYTALCRELREELSITVKHASPLIKISHQYSDKHVLLDVWLVDEYDGIAKSQLQQSLEWVSLSELNNYAFPEANQAIIKSLFLPPYYAITGEFKNRQEYLEKLQTCINNGIRLIQLRYKGNDASLLKDLAIASKELCDKGDCKLLVNAKPEFLSICDVDGIHLTSQLLYEYSSRPISDNKLLAASVHTSNDLQQAIAIKSDFVVISPIFKTTSHPDATPLGLDGLSELLQNSNIPVYALGGMKRNMLEDVQNSGAFGVAAISEFWK